MSHPPRGAGVSARHNHSSIHLLGVSAIALACALPQPAAAQALTEAQTTILERIVLTATRATKNVLDVPQNITVIDGETIEKHQVRDIQDLVRYEPGVAVTRQTAMTNPFGQLTGFTIRGVGGNRVQMLVDGSRVAEQIIDGSRDYIDPWNLEAVELVRGPNSVLWGADALGGTVAFRTRDPSDLLDNTDKPWALELRTGWDSYDNSFRKQVTAAYDFGNVQVLGSIGHLSAEEPKLSNADPEGGDWDCPRPSFIRCDVLFPTETNAWNGLAKVVWTPNDDHEVKLTAEFFSRNTEVDQTWDAFAEDPLYASNPLYYGFFYESEDYVRNLDMSRTRLALEHKWEVDAPWLDSVEWKVAYSPQKREMFTEQLRNYSLLTPAQLRKSTQVRDYGETFLEGDLQMVSSFELGETSHTLTYGFDGDIAHTDYEGTNTTENLTLGTDPVTTPFAGFNFPRVETIRADFYVQDEIALLDDRLTITPGLRLANYSIDPTVDDDYVPLPGFEPEKVETTKLIKKLGAVYKLDDTYSIYAAYGEGFKMPTSQQTSISVQDPFSFPPIEIVPNPDLRPESVASYEAGIRGEFANGYFTVGAFYSKYKDFIRSLQPVPGEPNKYTSDNVSSVELWGIEAGAEWEFVEDLTAFGSLAWSEGVQQIDSSSPETVFDGGVPLTVIAGLRYALPENGLEFEVVGTLASGVSERSDPNAFKPDGYALLDAYVTWKPAENVELTAGIQNIFDTRYFPNTLTGYNAVETDPDVAAQNPLELQTGPGRTFKLGAKVTF